MKEYIYQLKINGYTFPAVALWNSLGFYCGYLGIDETNGLHVSEEDRPDNGPRSSVRSGHGYVDINVHGGVTFSGYFSILDKLEFIVRLCDIVANVAVCMFVFYSAYAIVATDILMFSMLANANTQDSNVEPVVITSSTNNTC